jgi:hypothetical protein
MPPRTLTLAIVGFWLAMAGLFFWHELWPRLEPSEPLLYPVDIVDEAGYQNEVTSWEVTKNGTPGYRADVDWRYHSEDDSFESQCDLAKGVTYFLPRGRADVVLRTVGALAAAPGGVPIGALTQHLALYGLMDSEELDPEWEAPRSRGGAMPMPDWLPEIHNVHISSSFFLTRHGDLRKVELTSEYTLAKRTEERSGTAVKAEIGGAPRSGRFTPHVQQPPAEDKLPRGKPPRGLDIGAFHVDSCDGDGATVPVLGHGTVLSPLHPPRRFPNIQEGQRWRAAVIDPLPLLGLAPSQDRKLAGTMREAGLPVDGCADVLDARVLPGIRVINWELGKAACRVVHCTGVGPVASITYYVREHDGTLMRQDTRLWGDSWSFLRRPHGFKMRGPTTRKRT